MQHNYVDMQHFVNMQDNYVKMRPNFRMST